MSPTNDMDIDMLAAFEDLLDTWPGTLLVVSHDRYFLERVTDQQYAIIDGHLRHLPGGVDEYLRMETSPPPIPRRPDETAPAPAGRPGAELRAAQKEIAAIDRKLARLAERIEAAHEAMARHDQSDYQGLIQRAKEVRVLQDEVSDLETRWLELSEQVG